MDTFSSSQLVGIDGITAEHLSIFENKIKFNKAKLRQQSEAKQQMYAKKKQMYENRVTDLAKRRKVKNLTRIMKNEKRIAHFRFSLCTVKLSEYYKNLDRVAESKNRHQRQAMSLAYLKQNRTSVKQENAMRRRTAVLEKLHDKKMKELQHQQNMNKTFEKPDDAEEKFLDNQCTYVEKNRNVLDPELSDIEQLSFTTGLMNRLANLKINFESCAQGAAFFSKTKPLWDKMSRCLRENSSVVVGASTSGISTEYRNKFVENDKFGSSNDNNMLTILVQQLMGNSRNYYTTDKELVVWMNIITKWFEPDVDANEILNMVRLVVERTANTRAASSFIVNGFIQKTVFEYAKREIAIKIFLDARKTVDRLQYINQVVTDEVIEAKDREQIEVVLNNLLNSNDLTEFDKPVDDEQSYVAIMTENAADRMTPLLESSSYQRYFANKPIVVSPFKGRDGLIKSFDGLIAMFLEMAHAQTVGFMVIPVADDTVLPETSAITMMKVYRISRKLAKLAFGMFRTKENTIKHYAATVESYKLLTTFRAPPLKYDRRAYIYPEPIVDVDYFISLDA